MTWLIYGGRGWIGGQLRELLSDNHQEHVLGNARVDDTDALILEIDAVRPSRVICLIGRTHGPGVSTIDYLEKGRPQLVENLRDNLYGPLSLAMVCREKGIHMTYVGTGCIFSYDEKSKVFGEDDRPNFFGSSYSICKGFTDRLFHLLGDSVLNVRIRMPVTDDLDAPRNFIHKIVSYKKICSIPNSISVLPDLLPILIDMIRRAKTGTINLVNPGTITHDEILGMYKEMIDPSHTYENMTIEEQDAMLAAGRSNNELSTEKLQSEYFVLPIYQSIQRVFKRVRKSILMRQPYAMSNVLVTGGLGFIGSNFIHELYMHIYSERQTPPVIVQVDKKSYCSRREYIEDVPGVRSYEDDINDTDRMLEIMNEFQIDTIVHFAAQSHVDLSFNNSIQFTWDNVRGTHSILDAARRYGRIRRFLHVSTDEVYGETVQREGFTENQVPNPTNPYAATKISAEFIVQSYFHCFELPIIVIRGNNVYGPRQFPEKLIPRFITLLLTGRKCTIHGNGETRRNFIHVVDMCRAILLLLEKGVIGEIYNIGDTNEYSVMDIARYLITKIKGSDADVSKHIRNIGDRYYNDFAYRIDSSKLRGLGWSPRMTMEDGLNSTIEWYRKHHERLYVDA